VSDEAGRITCPECGAVAVETMPADYCLFFYDCKTCRAVVKPLPGDCCVFCSYGDRRCPSSTRSSHPTDPDPAG
jgi:hypothetical protein